MALSSNARSVTAEYGILISMTTAARIIEDALTLSPAERMDLIDRLWATVEAEQASLELTDAHRRELDRRIANMEANPGACSSWDNVRKALENR